MNPPPGPRVFIVDDHPVVRAGARLAVSALEGWQVCGESDNAALAPGAAQSAAADIVVLDLMLGARGGDGLELVSAMRSALPRARILVFSMNSEDLFAARALRAGAHGYLAKGGDLLELQHALASVQSGEIFLSPRMKQRQPLGQGEAAVPEHFGPLGSLTDREMQVFLMLGAGKSTPEIAAELGLSAKTVSAHRENIKVKLGASGAPELVRHAVAYVVGQRQSA